MVDSVENKSAFQTTLVDYSGGLMVNSINSTIRDAMEVGVEQITGVKFGESLKFIPFVYLYLWFFLNDGKGSLEWLHDCLQKFFGLHIEMLGKFIDALNSGGSELINLFIAISVIIAVFSEDLINKGSFYPYTLITVLILVATEISNDFWDVYSSYLLYSGIPIGLRFLWDVIGGWGDARSRRMGAGTPLSLIGNSLIECIMKYLFGPAIHIGIILVSGFMFAVKYVGLDFYSWKYL